MGTSWASYGARPVEDRSPGGPCPGLSGLAARGRHRVPRARRARGVVVAHRSTCAIRQTRTARGQRARPDPGGPAGRRCCRWGSGVSTRHRAAPRTGPGCCGCRDAGGCVSARAAAGNEGPNPTGCLAQVLQVAQDHRVLQGGGRVGERGLAGIAAQQFATTSERPSSRACVPAMRSSSGSCRPSGTNPWPVGGALSPDSRARGDPLAGRPSWGRSPSVASPSLPGG